MRVSNVVIVATVGLCLAAVIVAAPPTREDPARQTLLAMLLDADIIEANADTANGTLEATQGFIPLRSLEHRLGPREKKVFDPQDAWGRPILFWSDSWNYMLLSRGSDGELEFDYSTSHPPYLMGPTGLTDDATQDIIIANGVIQRGPFMSRQAAPNSEAALRSIGTAVESYAIDHNFYPNTGTTLASTAAIRSLLEPSYIRRLPLLDGWGRPILYWTDISGRPSATHYAAISVGVDGVPDDPYEMWTRDDFLRNAIGSFTDLRRDTIFMDGDFIQSPLGNSTPHDRQRQSMAWMRSIATAVEEYAIDNNFYPGSGGSVAEVSSLAPYLTPYYIRVLPTVDGFNEPFLYYSQNLSYWIVSTGSDRTPDNPYQSWQLTDFENHPWGPVTTLDRDIVFATGQFVQYPGFIP